MREHRDGALEEDIPAGWQVKRLELFRARTESHILYRRLACKLPKQDIEACESFINENDELPYQEFEIRIGSLVSRPGAVSDPESVEALLLMSNCAKRYERPKEGHDQ